MDEPSWFLQEREEREDHSLGKGEKELGRNLPAPQNCQLTEYEVSLGDEDKLLGLGHFLRSLEESTFSSTSSWIYSNSPVQDQGPHAPSCTHMEYLHAHTPCMDVLTFSGSQASYTHARPRIDPPSYP